MPKKISTSLQDAGRATGGAAGSDVKRLSILAAAREVFLRHGFQAASMDQIAAVAGVSKVTIYSKFGSKEELFGAIVDGICEQILAIEIVIPEIMESVEEGLTELAVNYSKVLYDPEVLALVRLAIADSQTPRNLGPLYYRAGPLRARQELIGLFGSLTESGALAITDLELAADQFLALIQPQRYYALLDPSTRPTDRQAAAAARRGVEVFLSRYRCAESRLAQNSAPSSACR